MADELDVDALIERFRARARAVKSRGMPPVEGPERRKIMEAMQQDYMDFAMLGDATGSIEDGWLVLRVDLRPPGTRTENGEAATG
ncbi:MAG TPA: hypothetical protein VM390_05720 [Acidimicrobiales bacterium]|jgi:hypothetical protein|nr:hypothetical protein [Acidimicrobiales bacterium]